MQFLAHLFLDLIRKIFKNKEYSSHRHCLRRQTKVSKLVNSIPIKKVHTESFFIATHKIFFAISWIQLILLLTFIIKNICFFESFLSLIYTFRGVYFHSWQHLDCNIFCKQFFFVKKLDKKLFS